MRDLTGRGVLEDGGRIYRLDGVKQRRRLVQTQAENLMLEAAACLRQTRVLNINILALYESQ